MTDTAVTARWLLPGLALLLAGAAVPDAPVTVAGAWIPAAPPGMEMMAGYATLHNRSSEAVVITGAHSPNFARVEFHRTVQRNGMARMEHLPRLQVQGGGRVELAPGGLHLMLMGPRRELKPGDLVEITFTTGAGQRIRARFTVRPRDAGGGHSH